MDRFRFCPNSLCTQHLQSTRPDWYSSDGFHDTKAFGPVPRFRCKVCRRSFSTQTFSVDYFAKRRVNYSDLAQRHGSSMSLRALSRSFNVSCGTIMNRIDRLARQGIALHAALRPLAGKHEAVCIDGFVSFDVSQFFPSEVAISIAAKSLYVLDLSHATRRRSGTMTSDQAIRAKRLYARVNFEKGAIARGFSDLLPSLEVERPPTASSPLVIITDEKKEYAIALERSSLWRAQDDSHRVAHLTVNSRLPRCFANPLFASNYIDREIRKDQANHHRETVCFNRNVANGMSRLALYLINHNYRKRYRIKAKLSDQRSHAQIAGIAGSRIASGLEAMFSERAFLSRLELPATLRRIWLKAFPTPLKMAADYLPAFAFG